MGLAYTDPQIMLCLALAAYRGFWLPPPADEDELATLIRCGLEEIEPLRGQWELCWGPGTFGYLGASFDDSAMFVVRSTTAPARYAIVVRGTNPMAPADWVLGDLMVNELRPWEPGGRRVAEGAAISLSTALGLRILLHMGGAVQGDTSGLGPSPGAAARPSTRRADRIAGFIKKGRAAWHRNAALAWQRQAEREKRRHRQDGWRHRLATRWVDRSVKKVSSQQADLWQAAVHTGNHSAGPQLVQFLRRAVRAAEGKVELYVTGHSKGGALAPTLALHLADTQGTDGIAAADRWDPDGRAEITTYAFACPTAGNEAFAAHSDAVIGPRCHRYANELDLVVYAFCPADLRKVPDLYDEHWLGDQLLTYISRWMHDGLAHHGYAHIGQHVHRFRSETTLPFPALLLHHHLIAYIEHLGLRAEIPIDEIAAEPWDLLGHQTKRRVLQSLAGHAA